MFSIHFWGPRFMETNINTYFSNVYTYVYIYTYIYTYIYIYIIYIYIEIHIYIYTWCTFQTKCSKEMGHFARPWPFFVFSCFPWDQHRKRCWSEGTYCWKPIMMDHSFRDGSQFPYWMILCTVCR